MPVIRRIAALGRPFADPGCAGCPQLATFRALRRAGLAVQGRLGCDPSARTRFAPASGRWAAVVGVDALRRRARALLDEAIAAGASLVVIADSGPELAGDVEALLAAAGVRPARIDPADVRGAEDAVSREAAAAAPGLRAIVTLATCARTSPRGLPLEVLASRCNRCGACLGLGCPAISDDGEEAMRVDPGVCTGCARCVPLCRNRALRANAEPECLPYSLASTPGC